MIIVAIIFSIVIVICLVFWNDIIKIGYRYKAKYLLKDKYSSNSYKKGHLSLDDTIEIFKDLTDNQNIYTSIFDNKILAYLRKLHKCYGIVVSLYCFYENNKGFNLGMVPSKYADEFKENTDWLKFGFHGRNYSVTYNQTTAQEAGQDYQLVVTELQRICGGLSSLTRVVRLSSFQGNIASLQEMSQYAVGICGLFTADDERHSYELSESEENMIKASGYIKLGHMNYYHTDIRVEQIFNKKTVENILCDKNICVIFTHEYFIMSRKIQKKLEWILFEAIKRQYQFSFFE